MHWQRWHHSVFIITIFSSWPFSFGGCIALISDYPLDKPQCERFLFRWISVCRKKSQTTHSGYGCNAIAALSRKQNFRIWRPTHNIRYYIKLAFRWAQSPPNQTRRNDMPTGNCVSQNSTMWLMQSAQLVVWCICFKQRIRDSLTRSQNVYIANPTFRGGKYFA